MGIEILWPERRVVSEETVIGWAQDSWWNNADWYDDRDHPVHEDGTPKPTSLEDAITWLNDTGEVTFAKRTL